MAIAREPLGKGGKAQREAGRLEAGAARGAAAREAFGNCGSRRRRAAHEQQQAAQAVFQRITAPVLAVQASDDSLGQWWKGRYTLAEYHQRLQVVADVRIAEVADAGHMLHHDQPALLAGLIEDFLA